MYYINIHVSYTQAGIWSGMTDGELQAVEQDFDGALTAAAQESVDCDEYDVTVTTGPTGDIEVFSEDGDGLTSDEWPYSDIVPGLLATIEQAAREF